jgi:hypothetical protein
MAEERDRGKINVSMCFEGKSQVCLKKTHLLPSKDDIFHPRDMPTFTPRAPFLVLFLPLLIILPVNLNFPFIFCLSFLPFI